MPLLTLIAWISLAAAFLSALVIAIDELRHPQKMWIMNVVWPITALYFSVAALWAYYRIGRGMSHEKEHKNEESRRGPTWRQTAVSVSHCGAGCTLGDIIAEFSIFGLGVTLLGTMLYVEYAGDLLLAWLLGIVFQYFSIRPMQQDLSPGHALTVAIKADTLSILAFEVGLFAWMAITYFVLFPAPHLTPKRPAYWFMMQIGMVFGYFTSYPMNQWLIKAGWKEAMG